MARKQYAEAEPLLISGYNGLRDREARIPAPNKPRLEQSRRTPHTLLRRNGAARQGRRMETSAGPVNQTGPKRQARSRDEGEMIGLISCNLSLPFPLYLIRS